MEEKKKTDDNKSVKQGRDGFQQPELEEENNDGDEGEEVIDSNDDIPSKSPLYFFEIAFVLFFFILPADICDLFSLTGIGAVVSWMLDIVAMGVTAIWLFMRGRRAGWNLIVSAIEFIPVVDIIPWRTLAILILYAIERVPMEKILAKEGFLQKAYNMINKIKK